MIGRHLGDYVVTARLGRGGMGAVYRALDTRSRAPMAIKVLAESFSADPQVVKRFELEQEIVARLEHPGIVRGHGGVRFVDGIHYFVMDYVPGANLAQVMRALGRLTVAEALHLALQTCDALAFAHAQGVVHRDLKPSNLLIDTAGNVRITDFGLAKVAELTRLTLTGQVLGTPEYMSPEQAEGRTTDLRSDLYSTGILLYEMVTGRLPFAAENPLAVLRKHIEEAAPPPTQYAPELPPALAAAILRCLEKDPARRFEGATPLADALRAAVPPVPADAPPTDPRARILTLVATHSLRETRPYVTAAETAAPSAEPGPAPARPALARLALAAGAALLLAGGVVFYGIVDSEEPRVPARPGAGPGPAPAKGPPPASAPAPALGLPGEDAPPTAPRAARITLASGAEFPVKVLALDAKSITVRKEDGSQETYRLEEVKLLKYAR